MNIYLRSSEFIDWENEPILEKASNIAVGMTNPIDVAKACFMFVRDEIKHSHDFKLDPVTCKATNVLRYETGYCYAKSHLLAALLRANNIPAGLCYQRLKNEEGQLPYCLHGLNAVLLPDYGWYRIDARGNKQGVQSDFDPPHEKLAFRPNDIGEADFIEIWPEPLPIVIEALKTSKNYQAVASNLPDIEIVS